MAGIGPRAGTATRVRLLRERHAEPRNCGPWAEARLHPQAGGGGRAATLIGRRRSAGSRVAGAAAAAPPLRGYMNPGATLPCSRPRPPGAPARARRAPRARSDTWTRREPINTSSLTPPTWPGPRGSCRYYRRYYYAALAAALGRPSSAEPAGAAARKSRLPNQPGIGATLTRGFFQVSEARSRAAILGACSVDSVAMACQGIFYGRIYSSNVDSFWSKCSFQKDFIGFC